jgi:hypothetical protein
MKHMTKNELKSALDLAGVSYAKKANLETLQALFDQHCTPAPATPELPAVQDSAPEAPTAPEAPAAQDEPTPTPEATAGLKIEKDRPEQNGIKRPSIGGKCRAIWDALDAYRAETGELPTSKTVKELAADEGWNPNNASIEYYQWRKYNGISKQS